MTVVVDLGCCPIDGDDSIGPLIERFHPATLYGFDPLLRRASEKRTQNGTSVVLAGKAAWTYDGTILLGIGAPSLLDATVAEGKNDRAEWSVTVQVPCFDFPSWLGRGLLGGPIVKMNIEGAEFELLQYVRDRNDDLLIGRLIVSWHDRRMGPQFTEWRQRLERDLRCPLEEWTL